MTVADIERLLQLCCADPTSEAELSLWRLVKKDAEQPFSANNAMWIKRGGEAQLSPPAAPPLPDAAPLVSVDRVTDGGAVVN
jgi:hypothetical protein